MTTRRSFLTTTGSSLLAVACAPAFQYPVGISAVVVNGVVALRDGQRSAAGSGRAIRAV